MKTGKGVKPEIMDNISINDFVKLDIRTCEIVNAERVEGTEKLLKLEVDAGTEKRTLVAGIALSYTPEEIKGKQIPVLMNLEPRTIRGIESRGMMLAVDVDGKPVLLYPEKAVPSGSALK
ncbi:MAG: methionine--tRNA ligase [Elusimicrobiota bacterium]